MLTMPLFTLSTAQQAEANSQVAKAFLARLWDAQGANGGAGTLANGLPYWGSMSRTMGGIAPGSDLGQVKSIRLWVTGQLVWGLVSRTAMMLKTELPMPPATCPDCEAVMPYRESECEACSLVGCEHCGDMTHEDDTYSVIVSTYRRSTETWCQGCAQYSADYCHGCEEYTSHGASYPRECYGCGVTRCEGCSDDWSYCDSCDESHCGGCGCDCSEGPCEGVYPYGYCPPLVTHGGKGATFGLELEVGCDTESVTATNEGWGDFLWWTEDCSVYDGAELTTHPATWGHLRETLPAVLATLRDTGAHVRNPEGYGLHVHIGRKESGLTGDTLEAFIHLVYANIAQFRAVARRNGEQWAPVMREYTKQPAQKLAYGEFGGGREAVNLLPGHTVEVRLGASSTDTAEVLAWVGLLAAAVEYSKQHQGNLGAMCWEAFMGWVFTSEFGPDILPTVYRLTVAA